MGFDGLIEMTKRSLEGLGLEQLVHLVVGLGELDFSRTLGAYRDVSAIMAPDWHVAVARQASDKGQPLGAGLNHAGGVTLRPGTRKSSAPGLHLHQRVFGYIGTVNPGQVLATG
jgi:hypothetical protein